MNTVSFSDLIPRFHRIIMNAWCLRWTSYISSVRRFKSIYPLIFLDFHDYSILHHSRGFRIIFFSRLRFSHNRLHVHAFSLNLNHFPCRSRRDEIRMCGFCQIIFNSTSLKNEHVYSTPYFFHIEILLLISTIFSSILLFLPFTFLGSLFNLFS